MLTIELADSQFAQQWDEYVQGHAQASPYHLYAWGQACQQAYGHSPYYWYAKEEGRVVGVLPAVKMNVPFKKGELCSLPFCDVAGALADSAEIAEQLEQQFKQQAARLCGNQYSLRSGGTEAYSQEEQEALKQKAVAPKVRMLFDLPEDAEALMASFKSKLRSQIRKAEKNGLSYKIANTEQGLKDFYQVFSLNMRDLGSPVHGYSWFKSLMEFYGDKLILSLVYLDETPVGAGIVLCCGEAREGEKSKAIAAIPWASTVAQYNRLSPNMLLYWSLLKEVCDRGCQQFDFGRSSFSEGTFKFKAQWGAEPCPLIWRDSSSDAGEEPAPSNKSSLRSTVENIWRRLPLPIANSAGPMLRKYISL